MGNYDFDKMTKEFIIGDYKFTIGLNREMAVRFFKSQPEYFNVVREMEKYENLLDKGNELSADDYLNMISLSCDAEKYAKEIVDKALPEMLAYANYLDCNVNTKAYADDIIKFCNENEILYNEVYEDDNGEKTIVKGFYMLVMEFIAMGFMRGMGAPKNKKPKMTIVTK